MTLSPGIAHKAVALRQATQGELNCTVFTLPLSLHRYSEGTGSVIQEKGDREDVYARAGQAPDDRVSLSNPLSGMLLYQVNILGELGLRYFSTKEVARLKLNMI